MERLVGKNGETLYRISDDEKDILIEALRCLHIQKINKQDEIVLAHEADGSSPDTMLMDDLKAEVQGVLSLSQTFYSAQSE